MMFESSSLSCVYALFVASTNYPLQIQGFHLGGYLIELINRRGSALDSFFFFFFLEIFNHT
jgi:hypothetical protein